MHNIESYTLNIINQYWDLYMASLKKQKGKDVDYPSVQFNIK